MDSVTPAGEPERPARPVARRTVLQAAAVALGAVPVAGCDSGTDRSPAAASTSGPAPTGSGPAPGSPTASASTAGAALPAELAHGPRDRPNVALTFHGQGDPGQVRALLDELDRGGARVTVLAVGSWLQAQPAMARRILDAGHELGNHTQNHLAIAGMDAAHAYAEIDSCARVLKKLTGSVGRWFRPSQTQYSTATIRAQAAKAGYPTCLSYDLDSLDYTDPAATAIVGTVAGAIQNGSIVSMHFGHAATLAAIPPLLDRLRQRGLKPVTVTELVS
ncbi:MAG: polysaccharide deacetylase [Actinobacteria bacterium 13_2_20CM_2_71_6]|nr:MAG: polysaccharide deacetylase [Actinobacteria bacterium 13_2_20CM_2_71_6]